jgi:hypothetical protein
MTSIYTNGFMGPQTERAWNDSIEFSDSDGDQPPTDTGDSGVSAPEQPAVIFTSAPPPNPVTYAPPANTTNGSYEEMDLETYLRVSGYDPVALEERNANGYYRSWHDQYQENGGFQSQAEIAWLRSGQWAAKGEAGDLAREMFINNYVDRAFGVDSDSGTSLNDVRYSKIAEDLLNTLASSRATQALAEARQTLERAGFDVRRVTDGPAFDRNLTDSVTEVFQPTKFVVDWSGNSGAYQTSYTDGFETIGNNGRPAPSSPASGPYFSNIGPERTNYVLTEDDWKPVGFVQTGKIKLEFTPNTNSSSMEGETVTGPQYNVPGRNGTVRGYGGSTATLPWFGRSEVFVYINVYDGSGKSIYETRIEGSTMFGVKPETKVIDVPPGLTTVRVANPEPFVGKQTTVTVSWPK